MVGALTPPSCSCGCGCACAYRVGQRRHGCSSRAVEVVVEMRGRRTGSARRANFYSVKNQPRRGRPDGRSRETPPLSAKQTLSRGLRSVRTKRPKARYQKRRTIGGAPGRVVMDAPLSRLSPDRLVASWSQPSRRRPPSSTPPDLSALF